jgi:hypothetical protein
MENVQSAYLLTLKDILYLKFNFLQLLLFNVNTVSILLDDIHKL